MHYTAFLGVRFEPEWFLKSRAEREEFEAKHLFPVIGKHAQVLQIQPFRAAAFSARLSNFFLVHFDDVTAYNDLVEELHECPLMAERFAVITDNVIGMQGTYYADREQA
ncbi:darcynin family protein [Streptomyces sp. NPDC021096]|uniref:darcynin family protein n=1 Tax=Streptomyces sp. NPDC021096 TaxID=3154792 RepID=UPI0033DDDA16